MRYQEDLTSFLSEYFHKENITSQKIILIKDNYFLIPEELTNTRVELKFLNFDDKYILICHKNPVERDNLILDYEKNSNISNFLIIYDVNNDQFIQNLKAEYKDMTLNPGIVLKLWLGIDKNFDPILNYLSCFIWNSKSFILNNKELIYEISFLNEKDKLVQVIEIILKNSVKDLIYNGFFIEILDPNNLWVLKSIFSKSNYLIEEIYKNLKTEFDKYGVRKNLFNYLKNLVLNFKVELIIRIFIIAALLERINENSINSVNFNCFIDEFEDITVEEKEILKNLNRGQLKILSRIIQEYFKSAKNTSILNLLSTQLKFIGKKILLNSNLKEITIDSPYEKDLDFHLRVLKLSNSIFFFYSPYFILKLFFNIVQKNSEIFNWRYSSKKVEFIGVIRKASENLKNNPILFNSNYLNEEFNENQKILEIFCEIYDILNRISFTIRKSIEKWNAYQWIYFYTDLYVKLKEEKDLIIRIKNFEFLSEIKTEIINWLNDNEIKLEAMISKHFFNFIKLNYPKWIKNYNHPELCPTLTSNVFKRIISKYYKKSNLTTNFIILIDGCSVENWRIIEKNLNRDFSNYILKTKYIFSIIPPKTKYSRKAIFLGDLMKDNSYFRKLESQAFLDLLENANKIRLNIGNHSSFFNTHCERNENYSKVLDNIRDKIFPQIIIFNFSDQLNEQFDQSDVNSILQVFYKKIRELLEIIFGKNRRSRVFFLTDHGIINANKKIYGISFTNSMGQNLNYRDLMTQCKHCSITTRLIELTDKYDVNFNSLDEEFRERILYLKNPEDFGLSNNHHPLIISSSNLTFKSVRKAHGGISMEELIIPFAKFSLNGIERNIPLKINIHFKNEKEYSNNETDEIKIKLINNSMTNVKKLEVHLITDKSHQIRYFYQIKSENSVLLKFLCTEKGRIKIKIQLVGYTQNLRQFVDKKVIINREDYREVIKSKIDDLIDEEL